jgi:hypothetical protein
MARNGLVLDLFRGLTGVCDHAQRGERRPMNGLIYLIGLIVVIMFILSFLGLR